MTFAKWTFRLAGIYGLLVLVPMYFFEQKIGRDFPPAITHPEHFYGFLGVAVAWQFAFLLLAQDPVRYRPLMLVAVLEKAGYGIATVVLFSLGRISRRAREEEPNRESMELPHPTKHLPQSQLQASAEVFRLVCAFSMQRPNARFVFDVLTPCSQHQRARRVWALQRQPRFVLLPRAT